MRTVRSERFWPLESAAMQHSDTAPRRNWSTACAPGVPALAPRDRAHDCLLHPLRRGARIVGAGDGPSEHEDVAADTRDLVRRTDTRLIVTSTVVESNSGNDRDEVGAARVHALHFLHRTDDTTATGFDRAFQ